MKKTNLPTSNTPAAWEEWLKSFLNKNIPHTKEDWKTMRDAIMTSETAAATFFFKTNAPMNAAFAAKLNRDSNLREQVKPEDIATYVYDGFYDEGRWTRLKGYEGECSLFSWVALGGTQIIQNTLESLGILRIKHSNPARHYSLCLKSMRKEECREVVNLVSVKTWRKLLTLLYVEHHPEAEVMEVLGLDEDVFRKTRKVAELTLKERLLAVGFLPWFRHVESRDDTAAAGRNQLVNLVSIALSDVTGRIDTTSSDQAMARADAMAQDDDRDGYTEFWQLLAECYPGMFYLDAWRTLALELMEKCDLNETTYNIWVARFVDSEGAESVATRLGIRRSAVDNQFCRANRELKKQLRAWWRQQA